MEIPGFARRKIAVHLGWDIKATACTESLRALLSKLHLGQFAMAMANAGVHSTTDLAFITSPDDLPGDVPGAARKKLATHLGWDMQVSQAASPQLQRPCKGNATIVAIDRGSFEQWQRLMRSADGHVSWLPWGLKLDAATMTLKGWTVHSPAEDQASESRLDSCVGKVLSHVGGEPVNNLEQMMAAGAGYTTLRLHFVAIVFTDIVGSTRLWESRPEAMEESLDLHNSVIREEVRNHAGYEVKTIGDSFMISFTDAVDAVLFGITVQESLVDAPWPHVPQFGAVNDKWDLQRDSSGDVLWNGIAIRVGIAYGVVKDETNPITQRVDYRGRTVNLASRCESSAPHGAVNLSEECYQRRATR
eukprot:gene57976-biopygen40663